MLPIVRDVSYNLPKVNRHLLAQGSTQERLVAAGAAVAAVVAAAAAAAPCAGGSSGSSGDAAAAGRPLLRLLLPCRMAATSMAPPPASAFSCRCYLPRCRCCRCCRCYHLLLPPPAAAAAAAAGCDAALPSAGGLVPQADRWALAQLSVYAASNPRHKRCLRRCS